MTRRGSVWATVSYEVDNLPEDDEGVALYADESANRIAELLEGLPGVLEHTVTAKAEVTDDDEEDG